jgi:hypothetical protein
MALLEGWRHDEPLFLIQGHSFLFQSGSNVLKVISMFFCVPLAALAFEVDRDLYLICGSLEITHVLICKTQIPASNRLAFSGELSPLQ